MVRLDGVCAHCAPYLNVCDHVCPTCGKPVDMDNCDGEVVDGRMVGYEGSTQGEQCREGCYVWFHTACGDTKNQLCKPCMETA